MIRKSSFFCMASTLLAGLAMQCLNVTHAHEIDLGTAGQYSAFILGDANGMVQVEGRLAVGRDLNANKLDIGSKLPHGANSQPSLVVGRNVKSFANGDIMGQGGKKGYGVYAGSKANANNKHDLRKNDTPIDFAAEAVWLSMLSSHLHAKQATGTVALQGSTLTLQGRNLDVEVFTLASDQVAYGKTLKMKNIKSTAYLIINVLSDKERKISIGLKQDALSGKNARVLFNFPDADVVKVDGNQINGSVLAPYACIVPSSGRIEGTVIAASWDNSMPIGYAPFLTGP